MRLEPIDTSKPSEHSLELARSYADRMKAVRRPLIGDILAIGGAPARVLGVGPGGETIQVEDHTGKTVTLSREPFGWWHRA
jgi:hypothetical protein